MSYWSLKDLSTEEFVVSKEVCSSSFRNGCWAAFPVGRRTAALPESFSA
jgi:hypothetical protein